MRTNEILILEDGDLQSNTEDTPLNELECFNFKYPLELGEKSVIIMYRGKKGVKVFKDRYNITN